MKLYSSFKDYYDGIIYSTFNEPNLHYKREQQSIDYRTLKKYPSFPRYCKVDIIGFCGELHYAFKSYHKNSDSYDVLYFKTFEEAYKYSEAPKRGDKYIARLLSMLDIIPSEEGLKQIFRDYKTAIFTIEDPLFHNQILTINDSLDQFNFQKVYDPYSAAMKLDQYVNNDMVDLLTKSIEEPSNDIKILSKGFDLKQSFRHRK